MAGLTLCRGAEHRRYIVVAFHVSLGCEIQVTAVCLGFTGKCVFEVAFSLAAFQ
jgi:hypothetical protein